jgi:hypothetical protein
MVCTFNDIQFQSAGYMPCPSTTLQATDRIKKSEMLFKKSEMLWEWEKYGIFVEGSWDDDINKMGCIEGTWSGFRILSSKGLVLAILNPQVKVRVFAVSNVYVY